MSLCCYYIDEMDKWAHANPRRFVFQFQVSALFGKAYSTVTAFGMLKWLAHAGVDADVTILSLEILSKIEQERRCTYTSNIEERPRYHRCRGTAVSAAYSVSI
jgi:hypothetical protein